MTKTERQLKKNYLSDPDPVAWLVMADYFEEHGDDASARKWRRRAESFAELFGSAKLIVAEFKGASTGFTIGGDSIGRYSIGLHRKKKTIRLFVSVTLGARLRFHPYKSNLWALECAAAKADLDKYLTRKCLEVIDYCGDHEDGKPVEVDK